MSDALHDAHLDRFIRMARNVPSLDRDTEQELARLARSGDAAARERLLVANLRHVVSVALRYRRYGVPVADLVAEGNVGLCIAIDRFDAERGNRFVTYAGHWIRAYVLDAVLKSRTLVGGGAGALRSKIYFRLRRERARLAARAVDGAEQVTQLAEQFGTSEPAMAAMLQRVDATDVSLDAPRGDDDATTLVEALPAAESDALDQLAERRLHRLREERVARALSQLDPRERRIVMARHMEDDQASLASLGRELGVSRERARQLEERAYAKLRRCLPDLEALAA